MQIEIGEATQNDVTELVRLNCEVQDRHANLHPKIFRSDVNLDELHRQWSEEIGAANKTVAVARIDGKVAGYLYYEVQDRPPAALVHARKRLYIHHVVVDVQCRRRGVASALMAYAQEAASRAGIVDILLDAWASNLEALEFFKVAGYVPINIVFAKTLS